MSNLSKTRKNDLPDSKDDIQHMQPDKATLDLPDVKDIPGQEHVHPLPAGEMADTTISSADEEAKNILDAGEEELAEQYNSNVTKDERELLEKSADSMASPDDLLLEKAELDETDEDGELLNEKTDLSGEDLDIPGEEGRDDEEDEENSPYSLNDDKEDNINTLN